MGQRGQTPTSCATSETGKTTIQRASATALAAPWMSSRTIRRSASAPSGRRWMVRIQDAACRLLCRLRLDAEAIWRARAFTAASVIGVVRTECIVGGLPLRMPAVGPLPTVSQSGRCRRSSSATRR